MKTEPTEALKNLIREVFDAYDSDGRDIENVVDYESAEKAVRSAFEEGQSSPKIKQLEWLDDNFPYRGCSVFVDYIISNKIGSRYTVILDIGTGIRINSFETIDEAKTAAQADFEKRIKECLE